MDYDRELAIQRAESLGIGGGKKFDFEEPSVDTKELTRAYMLLWAYFFGLGSHIKIINNYFDNNA